MGYEVKIYCGTVSNTSDADKGSYMEVVAMVALSKVPDLSPSKTGTPVYFYYEQRDGDTSTTEDCYGDRLRAVPVKQMLEDVKKAQKRCPDYRRWKPAIALLESLVDFPGDKIYCVIYGY